MKPLNKIISSILLAGTLTSCSGYFENQSYNPDWYKIDDSGISKEVDTPWEIYFWVSKNITYKFHGNRCFFPQETLNNRYGDCDDLSVLAIAIYKARCDKNGSLLTGYTSKDGIGHAEPNFCGETFYPPYFFIPTKEYSFDKLQYYEQFYRAD